MFNSVQPARFFIVYEQGKRAKDELFTQECRKINMQVKGTV